MRCFRFSDSVSLDSEFPFPWWSAMVVMAIATTVYGAEPRLTFVERDGRVVIAAGEQELVTYVYRDPAIPRPYLAHVRTPSGIQVSRRHPPDPSQDATDHAELHPGIWLSFGDLSGSDYWRLKARTAHVRFAQKPKADGPQGEFSVVNHYHAGDGGSVLAVETCHYSVRLVPHGYLLGMTSDFRAGDRELVFGDQEEMGLGIRVATSLAVDRNQGGRILDSAGRRNGKHVWGQTAQWCDYAGPLDGRWVGMTVFADPQMFRPCWSHARDYGFLALNPFGRQAFTRGEPSQVVVKPDEVLRLRYAVLVHESETEADYRPETYYAAWGQR